MMLAAPDGPAPGEVTAGSRVTIHLLDGKLSFSFNVGDTGNPVTPRKVTRIKPTHGVYVNTGLRALSSFDCLYDADGGYLGLRPVGERR